MSDQVEREVVLIIPMHPNMELAAAQTGSLLAEVMGFDEKCVEEIQLAVIETCINAFEHSKSEDQRVHIRFIMKDKELELKITDQGIGFQLDQGSPPPKGRSKKQEMRKRGWASKQTLARALAEVRHYGWIRLVRPGEQLNRVAARYALTWLKLNDHEGIEAKEIGTTPNDWKETKPTWSPPSRKGSP